MKLLVILFAINQALAGSGLGRGTTRAAEAIDARVIDTATSATSKQTDSLSYFQNRKFETGTTDLTSPNPATIPTTVEKKNKWIPWAIGGAGAVGGVSLLAYAATRQQQPAYPYQSPYQPQPVPYHPPLYKPTPYLPHQPTKTPIYHENVDKPDKAWWINRAFKNGFEAGDKNGFHDGTKYGYYSKQSGQGWKPSDSSTLNHKNDVTLVYDSDSKTVLY